MSITMTIEVTPEQAVKIAEILSDNKATTETVVPVSTPIQSNPIPVAPAPVMPAPQAIQNPAYVNQPVPAGTLPTAAPVQTPMPVQTPPPVQPAPVLPTTPPVGAAKKYTMDELSLASRPIVEAGRQAELINLLHSFSFIDKNGVTQSVQSIRDLPEEQYPAFAAGIRQLGGRI